MSSVSVPRSVGEIDGFILMLQAACDDRAMNERLDRLLSLPDGRRQALVHSWVSDLIIARAPRAMIEAVACLADDRVAEKAYEVIYQCQRPKSHMPSATLWPWVVPAVGIAVMLGGLFLGLRLAGNLVQSLRTGLDSPAGMELFWRILPGAAGLAAALTAAAWLHAGRPRPWLAWLAAAVGSAAAVAAIAFTLVATSAPVTGCARADGALAARQLDDALAEFNTCLGSATLPPAVRAGALQSRSWVLARQGRYAAALADQEASLRLRRAPSPDERLLYARRLGQAGKWKESLVVIEEVERLEQASPREATRAHKLWALRAMGASPAGSGAPVRSSNSP
ncbi:MAG TPA: hypothetical protein VK981_15950 [Ramlibacter sp.]|nr:hypothetical protein [Ramlibacter sp.]